MLWKDVACKIFSISIPEEATGWTGAMDHCLDHCSICFFASHPPECTIIIVNCISRISIALIAMGKQYSRTVCCNLVMRRDLLSGKCYFHALCANILCITAQESILIITRVGLDDF